jgi:hypothetical protein
MALHLLYPGRPVVPLNHDNAAWRITRAGQPVQRGFDTPVAVTAPATPPRPA